MRQCTPSAVIAGRAQCGHRQTSSGPQAQHGSAPDIAGQDKANPASLIGSAAMLLQWLSERRGSPSLLRAARSIENAIDAVIATPSGRTADMGGVLGTRAFAQRVSDALGQTL